MRTIASHVPVIIGVSEFKNPSRRVEDALEPLELMLRALEAAAQDATEGQPENVLSHADAVSVVASST